jgi:hypothetical protein
MIDGEFDTADAPATFERLAASLDDMANDIGGPEGAARGAASAGRPVIRVADRYAATNGPVPNPSR